jgi:hypothetical protein
MRKKILWSVAIGIVLSGGLLYWFELRPQQIRKNCEFMIFSKERAYYTGIVAIRQNNEFRQCLVRNGLAPESLYVNTN